MCLQCRRAEFRHLLVSNSAMVRATVALNQQFNQSGALAQPPAQPHCQRWHAVRHGNGSQVVWQCEFCKQALMRVARGSAVNGVMAYHDVEPCQQAAATLIDPMVHHPEPVRRSQTKTGVKTPDYPWPPASQDLYGLVTEGLGYGDRTQNYVKPKGYKAERWANPKAKAKPKAKAPPNVVPPAATAPAQPFVQWPTASRTVPLFGAGLPGSMPTGATTQEASRRSPSKRRATTTPPRAEPMATAMPPVATSSEGPPASWPQPPEARSPPPGTASARTPSQVRIADLEHMLEQANAKMTSSASATQSSG